MIRQATVMSVRSDPAGDGHYHARRGSKLHRGVDYCCEPDAPVFSPVEGTITKHGCAYEDDLSWRYVQVTDASGLRHRLFYVELTLTVGDRVYPESVVGRAQDISARYPGQGMLPHVHYEIKDREGSFLNPECYSIV